MSGVVGVWNFDGEPVDRSLMARLSAPLAHRGPDGLGVWINGPVGLACQHLRVTPESLKENQPAIHPSGTVLIFDGRLDNREELLSELRTSHALSDASTDPDIVLAVYDAYGDQMAERLQGDFALGLFDPNRQTLLLARDAFGVRPLHYCRTGDTFLLASEIKAILAHPDVTTRPNDDLLADFLLGHLKDSGITFFQDIFNLPPAHTAVVTVEKFTKRRYWDFDPAKRIRFDSFEEYAEAFREVFEVAVRRRLRSAYPVAVWVSGGVDSSAVLCMAETLARRGRSSAPRLLGVSYVSAAGSPSDERAFLLDIERVYRTPIHRIPIGSGGVLNGSKEAVWITEGPFLDELWDSMESSLITSHELGARVLLTGHWSDQYLFHQDYLVDLFRRLEWRKVRAHLQEFGHWLIETEPRVFRRRFWMDLVKHHTPAPLLPFLRRVRPQRKRPWYAGSLRKRTLRRELRWVRKGKRFPTAYAQAFYQKASAEYHVLCLDWDNKVCATHGLEIAFPFLDRDLLSFLVAIPGEVHAWDGIPKGLLREAMRGVVPEPITSRRWKADFTHLSNKGMKKEYTELVDCLEQGGRAVELGYLKENTLKKAFRSSTDELNGPSAEFAWALCDLVGLELWLQVFFPRNRS